jgi:hypothetical protein
MPALGRAMVRAPSCLQLVESSALCKRSMDPQRQPQGLLEALGSVASLVWTAVSVRG